MYRFFKKEMPKKALTCTCALLSIALIVSGGLCQNDVDDQNNWIIGKNLLLIGSMTGGATLTYAGVHLLNVWNSWMAPDSDSNGGDEEQAFEYCSEEEHFFDNVITT